MTPSPIPAVQRPLAPMAARRLHAPLTDRWTRYDVLAYLEAQDMPSGEQHAFLAFQETSLTGAGWRVHVDSLLTAGGVFEPAAMVQQAQAATARGQGSFVWGYQRLPSATDARHIEFRVHVDNGWPLRLELYARLRRADGSPAGARTADCAWPAGPACDL